MLSILPASHRKATQTSLPHHQNNALRPGGGGPPVFLQGTMASPVTGQIEQCSPPCRLGLDRPLGSGLSSTAASPSDHPRGHLISAYNSSWNGPLTHCPSPPPLPPDRTILELQPGVVRPTWARDPFTWLTAWARKARVNLVSAGASQTLAASRIKSFKMLARQRAGRRH